MVQKANENVLDDDILQLDSIISPGHNLQQVNLTLTYQFHAPLLKQGTIYSGNEHTGEVFLIKS